MRIIKLNAIESTNTFLKDLSVNSAQEDFTIVVTEQQTSGRGQMNTKWVSETGKNLMFSVLINFNDFSISNQTFLNFAVAMAVFEALNEFKLPKLSVKWPNDILSEKKKICGVLIENNLKGMNISSSIIGIGINVNQNSFPENVPNASSLRLILNEELDRDIVFTKVIDRLKINIDLLRSKEFELLEDKYIRVLYKKNIPSMFKDAENVLFMGKILGVNTTNGKLQVELSDETIKEFALKEVSFA